MAVTAYGHTHRHTQTHTDTNIHKHTDTQTHTQTHTHTDTHTHRVGESGRLRRTAGKTLTADMAVNAETTAPALKGPPEPNLIRQGRLMGATDGCNYRSHYPSKARKGLDWGRDTGRAGATRKWSKRCETDPDRAL